MNKSLVDQLLPKFSERDSDLTDEITGSISRGLTEEELAHYSQLSPELAPVFEALISQHDSVESNIHEQYQGEVRW